MNINVAVPNDLRDLMRQADAVRPKSAPSWARIVREAVRKEAERIVQEAGEREKAA